MVGTRVGILHPGQMGASVAAAAASGGASVAWASEGRSAATMARAREIGLGDAETLAGLADDSDILLSVCPPAAALSLAEEVARHGFDGIYVDANAVSPETADRVATTVTSCGASFVDAGIIGLPPREPGLTRLYLSGPEAGLVAALFEGSVLGCVVLDGGAGAASALKMCYAAWTKGSDALLVSIRALAVAEGVESSLLEEWTVSQAGLADRSKRAAEGNAFKAWRFAPEMAEIAATFERNGLPSGFHAAASEVYARLAEYKDRDPAPSMTQVLESVLAPRP